MILELQDILTKLLAWPLLDRRGQPHPGFHAHRMHAVESPVFRQGDHY